jgi:predicted nucleotide-binding protein
MPYYHVYINAEGNEVIETDLSKNQLLIHIVRPFGRNRRFFCKGTIIYPEDVETIRIIETDRHSSAILPELKSKSSLMGLLAVTNDFELLEERARDVTREFIRNREKKKRLQKKGLSRSNNVFIVHGKDQAAVEELKSILQGLGLIPIILHEQASGSRTIIEKLEKYSNVGYAFVLLTPDDAGYCQYEKRILTEDYAINMTLTLQRLRTFAKKEHEQIVGDAMKNFLDILRGRARQNVVFEFGYFVGLLGRDRVCCLYKGDVELPSDMDGIVYVPFKKSVSEAKPKIVKELKAAKMPLLVAYKRTS